jgi:hypothetical protein
MITRDLVAIDALNGKMSPDKDYIRVKFYYN